MHSHILRSGTFPHIEILYIHICSSDITHVEILYIFTTHIYHTYILQTLHMLRYYTYYGILYIYTFSDIIHLPHILRS